MIELISAKSRGHAQHGWLDTYHSFSFSNYYNPARMGFSHLKVLNDDTVAAGRGFSTHGHRDMEIISYVLEGKIEHKDSQGNKKRLPAGEFQLMSAGRGIMHSEYNASSSQTLKFLQIWIEPDVRGGKPSYQQKDFGRKWGFTQIVSPTGEQGTLKIKQQLSLYQLLMKPQQQEQLSVERGNKVYVHLVSGNLEIEGKLLSAGDGAQITKVSKLNFTAIDDQNVQALVFNFG